MRRLNHSIIRNSATSAKNSFMMFMATMIIAMKIAMVITMMMMTMMRNLMRESFLMMRRNWMVWDFMVSEKLLK